MHNYLLYDAGHAALRPWRAMTEAAKLCFGNPFSPVAHTTFGRGVTAVRGSRARPERYQKRNFGLELNRCRWSARRVREEIVRARPFCNLLHFRKQVHHPQPEPRLLIVAPMSGHYATLLRGTVEAMLPGATHPYISDWVDASMQAPTAAGSFDLDDYRIT